MADLRVRTPRPNRENRGNGNDEERPPQTYSNYIYVRYDNIWPGDGRLSDGSVPSGKPFYCSPDITFSPADALGNPVVGTDVTIQALIFNDGFKDAFAVEVEFWWFNPSLALTEGNGHRLRKGMKTQLVTVSHDNYLLVTCPVIWQPQFDNGSAHECLVVRCRCGGEGIDGWASNPFGADLNRHVGQRNVNLSPVGTPTKLMLQAPNPFATSAAFSVTFNSIMVGIDMSALKGLRSQRVAGIIESAASGRRVIGNNGEPIDVTLTDVTERFADVRLRKIEKLALRSGARGKSNSDEVLFSRHLAAPDASLSSFGRTLGEFSLGAAEQALLEIDVPPAALNGGHFVVHQFRQIVRGIEIGGYSVICVPPDFPGDHKSDMH